MNSNPGILLSRLASLILLVLACSGCDDGTVEATGRLLVEGEVASEGQLILTPVGGGDRAVGMVDPQGAFQLVTTGGKKGIVPGSYTVTVRQKPNLDSKKQEAIKRRAAGLNLEDLTVMFLGPSDQPIEIPAEGIADLVIDIRRDDGWLRSVGD